MAGITFGMTAGFFFGVLYASGHFTLRIPRLSKVCCYFGMHDWKGLQALGWDECSICSQVKDVP